MNVLKINHLRIQYGEKVAVEDLSFHVEAGEIYGVLGPNGAGKTSTLEGILGLRKLQGGQARIFGLDPVASRSEVFAQVGVQFQASFFHSFIRVDEICGLTCSLYPSTLSWRVLLARFGLADKERQFVKDLSGGERQKLSVLLALLHRPKLVFLDELTTGLDPVARREVWQLLRSLRDDGLTVVLTSHYMDEVESLCDRLLVMNAGRVIQQGRVQQLVAESGQQSLEAAYLNWLAA